MRRLARSLLSVPGLVLLTLVGAGGCVSPTVLDGDDSGPPLGDSAIELDQTWADDDALPMEEGDDAELPRTPLYVFKGYRHPAFQRWDTLFQEEADAFNAEHGFVPGDPGWLDPNLLKSWALQESGSLYGPGADEWRAGDILQVHVPENWSSDKLRLLGLRRTDRVGPRESVRAGIRYAYAKASIFRSESRIPAHLLADWEPFDRFQPDDDGRLVPREVQGFRRYFTGWDNALRRYNGNRAPARNYDGSARSTDPDGTPYEMCEYYVDSIRRRVEDAR